ncbi:MAG: DNA polymerase IV [uncultured Solirubrobacteraceae bacterium]|uniref:DNA polymerase IV n=1 Tax=uncultured Solirubrobacteraceae bacterium TaxID=1162706 RepID=A0A6J4SIC8_9ACTN|nr:MAG: DNA polymerase IV [uncultured Solirubrobacteraceae bacterium]
MSHGRRVIAHLDCDAFYVSVELLRRPDLRGRPVVVAGSGPRAVVTTASYEARRYGVGSASPASRARRLCPDAVFLPPDFAAYRTKSREVWSLARERLPVLQVVGLDEGYADVTALERPLTTLRELVADIEATTGIVVSAGVGPNRLVAKVASDLEKPRGFVVLSREQACERLAGASPKLIPGIGPKTVERLRVMGIETIGALREAGAEGLAEHFGDRQARFLVSRAHFHDSAPVSTESGPAKSRSSETTFDVDVVSAQELEAALVRLSERLAESLQARGARGRTVAIKVRLDDWTTVTRARTLPEPIGDAATLAGVAVELLRAYAPPRPVRLLGVRLASFEDERAEGERPAGDPAQLILPV